MSRTKNKPTYFEVNCPECGEHFTSEEEMLKHYDRKHNSKTDLMEVKATRYLGGYSTYSQKADGFLSLCTEPGKVVFESDKFTFEIPIDRIKSAKVATDKEIDAMRLMLVGVFALGWQRENKMFIIQFEGEPGCIETAAFDHTLYIDDFANSLYNFRVNMKGKNLNDKSAGQNGEMPSQSYSSSKPREMSNSEPMAVLKLRLAKGEITIVQYEELRKIIESS